MNDPHVSSGAFALYTDTPCFFNDIAEELRLFIGMSPVMRADTPELPMCASTLISVTFCERGGDFIAMAKGGGEEYTYSSPAVSESGLLRKRYMKRCVKIAAFRLMRRLFPNMAQPWGSLTGIRPTHLLRELIEYGGAEYAESIMLGEFDVTRDKYGLASEIVKVQSQFIDTLDGRDVDVYIGIPYCKTRCLYCSFPSEVRKETSDIEEYIAALMRDITHGAELMRELGYRVRSMYIGGGTPTVLTDHELERVIEHALTEYATFGRELTVEAGRPDTITLSKLKVMRRMGVSRISINPQSMNEATLKLIGRSHSPSDIAPVFKMARELGFSSINMDIIAGLPSEGVSEFERTLDAIAALAPDNLTVHTLAVKRSSELKLTLEKHPLPDASVVSNMLRLGASFARALDMRPYYMYRQKYMRGNLENVGYAKRGAECVYNIDMMEEATSIMAHGASAMTKRVLSGERRVERIPNPKDIASYISKLNVLFAEKADLFMDNKADKINR